MRLNAKILAASSTVNSLKYVDQVSLMKGETVTVMFQLVDEETNQRYMPASGATLQAQVLRFVEYFQGSGNIRTSQNYSLTKSCTQPFNLDASIWQFTISATESANVASSNLALTLTEGSAIRKALVKQAISAQASEEPQ